MTCMTTNPLLNGAFVVTHLERVPKNPHGFGDSFKYVMYESSFDSIKRALNYMASMRKDSACRNIRLWTVSHTGQLSLAFIV